MPIPEKGKEIIKQSLSFMDKETALLADGLSPLESKIISAIMGKVNELTGGTAITDTKANAQKISALRNELKRIIRDSKWNKRGKRFLKSFDSLIDFSIDASQAINGKTVNKSILKNIRNIGIEKYEDLLFGESFERAIIEPHIRHLEELISTGADFNTIRAEVTGFAEGVQGVERYGTQIARDALSQFTGAVNTKIGRELGLKWISYPGSLIATSRAQCIRWVGFGFLHQSELTKEIAWAFANGSGMIEPTTSATFVINTGGWVCRHVGYYVSDEVVPDSSFERLGLSREEDN